MGGIAEIEVLPPLVGKIGLKGRNLLSINDLTNEQILDLFELGHLLETRNVPGTREINPALGHVHAQELDPHAIPHVEPFEPLDELSLDRGRRNPDPSSFLGRACGRWHRIAPRSAWTRKSRTPIFAPGAPPGRRHSLARCNARPGARAQPGNRGRASPDRSYSMSPLRNQVGIPPVGGGRMVVVPDGQAGNAPRAPRRGHSGHRCHAP